MDNQIVRKYEVARVVVEQLRALPGVEEVLILCTRNHTEIYCLSSRAGKETLLDLVHRSNGIPAGELERHRVRHHGIKE